MARKLLTDFELMLLLAILRVEEAYGVPIAHEIESTAGRPVVLGAVYAALDRLEERGMVASRVGDPTPERGGRAKRFYRVLPEGAKAVARAEAAFIALGRELGRDPGRS
jgi:PadR family transcriptional regulator PadR